MVPELIAPIDNRGPNTLKRALRSVLRSGIDVRIQVAFITKAGVLALLSSLQRTSRSGPVRIVTGLYQCVTEPEALRLLADAERKTRGRLQVRVSKEPRLHGKFYLVASRAKCTCVIGSSNLTTEGLSSPDELNVLIATQRGGQLFVGLSRRFDEEWKRNCVPVTLRLIRDYKAARPKPVRQTVAPPVLRTILGVSSSSTEPSESRGVKRHVLWRQSIDGTADKRTQEIVEDETSWKKFDWYSNPSSGISREDLILLFDLTWKAKTVQLVKVRDTTTVSVPTPDGRQFVAYMGVAGYPQRTLGKRLWKELIKLGVIRSRREAERRHRINAGKVTELKQLLRRQRAG
jgi:HKD family nuclease